uniref:sensor histidine kinase n=1 Tax=uncultured Draconibacterium sp. TaxID=1573823 RepID=UPI0032176606
MRNWEKERNKIIGLGEFSAHKSYYPELQEKLEELESAYKNSENILSSMADAVIIHTENGDFLSMNKMACTMLEINQQQISGYNYSDVVLSKCPIDKLYQKFKNIADENNNTIECTIQSLVSKKQIPVEILINSIRWYGNNALVSVVRDFTIRKKYEDSILEAKKKAEENDKLKSAFLANMSHEIRTPMNGIIGFVDLLQDPDLPEETRNSYLEILATSCNRLINTVNDIMEVSTIESGHVILNLSKLDINEILHNQYNFFKPEALKKQTTLTLSIPRGESMVQTDRTKFISVISNLIKNAIKFTQNGEIQISYKPEGSNLVFCVKDTGMGIAKDRQEAIFDRFVQANMKISNGYEGSGLGLSICKSYVEMLSGKIWVESEENKGSSFYFTIPFRQ